MGEDESEGEPALLQTMSSYIHKETGEAETFASKIDFCLWNILNTSNINLKIITTREENSTTIKN